MKVENPLMSRFASGTLGSQLIFRRTAQAHTAYLRFDPKQPHTEAQVNHHILFSLLAKRWYHLDQPAKDFWTPFAEDLKITRYNAYLGYNLHRLNPAQPANLIAWWPNLVPAGDVLHDLTSSRNDAEFVNLNPLTAWPLDVRRRGHVIRYDGTGYVDVPNPPSTTGPYTWAFWFKQDTYTAGSTIVDTDRATRYAQGYFSRGTMQHTLVTKFAKTPRMWTTNFDWHHYAGTWDQTNIRIYLDGSFIDLEAQNLPPAEQVQMFFGARGVGSSLVPFHGRVDDLRFYDRCLELPHLAELAAR